MGKPECFLSQMVKDKTGRVRYILFRLSEGKASRYQLIERLKELSRGEQPWLTVYTGTYGILRCRHCQKEEMIELLGSLGWAGREKNVIRIETVATSGTIRKLKRRL